MLARLRGSLYPFSSVSRLVSEFLKGESKTIKKDAQIAKQSVDVEYSASVRIAHARDYALRIRTQKSNRVHGWRCHECARSARVATERRINLSPAIWVRREQRVQHGCGVELHTS